MDVIERRTYDKQKRDRHKMLSLLEKLLTTSLYDLFEVFERS